ncbi:hypothetical protein [Deinococcus multiflagellatus]|uniref:AMP-dependent ligase C-terminal domain-containing protein n=1 Tax=Deinococcus multiflagellatus TaxID=1656887 RepID=A0ABW1ZT62_9DEIO|nr:hypothetical protein [Deinococcus multiflagellatus]MBZ9713628.1 hypothetical protein [Deinococcus multiflagellatus]
MAARGAVMGAAGDITRLLPRENGTGRSAGRMDRIRARSDDMMVLRGVNVYSTQIEAVLAQLPGLRPHDQLVLSRSGNLDELLRVKSERLDHALRLEIIRLVKAQVGVSIACELCEVGSLPRSEGGKLQRAMGQRGPR